MRKLFLKIVRIGLGVLLIVLGIIGWLLPIVPGVPLIIAGVALLSVDIPAVKRLSDRVLRYVREKRESIRTRRGGNTSRPDPPASVS